MDLFFHREQFEIYARLMAGDNVILSAPTSFGKSRIIDAVIASRRHSNVAVVVPTLALIDETRRRLSIFKDKYHIVTHLSQRPAEANLFLFTAERMVVYEGLPKVTFFVIDEFYKIDAMEEDSTRTVALKSAFYRLFKLDSQFFLLAPQSSRFLRGQRRVLSATSTTPSIQQWVTEHYDVPQGGTEIERLVQLARTLDEPTLIFCRSPKRANEVARALFQGGAGKYQSSMAESVDWIRRHFHPDWILPEGLLHGIGVHHGKIPRALAQYIVGKFNDAGLRFLVCTSTLIEGVNTKAKNVVVLDNKIAMRNIDFFTFNNIRGRSGKDVRAFCRSSVFVS